MSKIKLALKKWREDRLRLSVKEKTYLFRQLSYLIESGYSIENAVYQLRSRDEKHRSYLHKAVEKMLETVQATGSLSRAVEELGLFEQSVIYQVESGEISGELAAALMEISKTFEISGNIRRSVIVIMVYPMILIVVLLIAAYIMSTTLLPPVLALVNELDVELTTLSIIVIAVSSFVSKHIAVVVLVFFAICLAANRALKISHIRFSYDRVLLKIPIIKDVVRTMDLVRYANTFYSLFKSGVDLELSLGCAAKTVKNLYLNEQAIQARDLVIKHGLELAEGLSASRLFDETEVQLIDISVSTDKVCEVFKTIAEHASQELGVRLKAMMSLIEPITIIVLGLTVGAFVIGIYMPLTSVISSM